MGLNQSLSISLDSMQNNQLALSVVSHNIANLNTKGYIRQRVDFSEERNPIHSNSAIMRIRAMNGASITSLSNYIDSAKHKELIGANSDANYYNALKDSLSDLENVSDDLGDHGLNALLNNFYTASANLEQFPTDLSIRQQYVMAIDDVCEKFNYISNKYDSIQADKYNDITTTVHNINSLLSDLATINVPHVISGESSATQNQINAILSELSNYTNITYDQNTNGSYNVYIGNVALVRGADQMYEFKTEFNSESQEPLTLYLQSLQDDSKIVNIGKSITSGSFKADIDFLNGTNSTVGFLTVNDMRKAISDAKTAFKDAINNIQTFSDPANKTYAAYITTSGSELVLAQSTTTPGIPDTPPELVLFDSKGNLEVNSQVADNPFYIAAARINLNNYQPGEDWTKSIGNSDNANKFTALQNEKICSYGGGTNNCTLSQFLINNATKNGMDLASVESKADLYQGIADSMAEEFSNVTGVNLDEELADMIKYQRAYEASASVFSVVNNIMQTIIGLV